MQRILSSEQMKNADNFTINTLGISSEVLVERAGLAVANEIKNRFKGGRVLVCIGKGNNGEDGKVIANILSKTHGFSVATLNVYNGIFKLFDKKYDLIVDCIFGIGLNREVTGKYKTAIEKINSSGAFVISCDIPSGLNANTGKPMGVSVKANLTVAIQELKLGHFLCDGPDYCGEIVSKDIGISVWGDDFYKKLDDKDLSKYFSNSPRNVHKGSFPKVAIIGGSKAYSGSVILSTNALCALKMGCGYSRLVVPNSIFSVVAGVCPEIIIDTTPDIDGFLTFDKAVFEKLLEYDAIAIGMGVGVSKNVYEIISFLLTNYEKRLLIDADGINCLSKFGKDVLKNKKCEVVLTPHLGEFSRLVGVEKDVLLNDLDRIAVNFAKEYNVVLNVKSATSIITDGVETFINTTGVNGMAKAGSGDVLSGLTAGIIAKNFELNESVAVSAHLFGLCGEYAQNKFNQFTLTASDIISVLPNVINEL